MLNVNIRKISVKREGDSRTLLENVAFTLLPGNIYCIIGKNGCGKTTLLKSLTSLHDKKIFDVEGNVVFKGTDLLPLTDEHLLSLREKYIKYVFQDSVLSFNPLKKLSCYFQLPGVKKDRLEVLLKELMLPPSDEIGKLHSYEISGGMAQRLAISLALSASPLIFLLDEPNSGIDYPLSNLISNLLKDYIAESNAIALIITQDISLAENTGDYIGFINDSTFSGFFNKNELYSLTEGNNGLKNFLEAYKSL